MFPEHLCRVEFIGGPFDGHVQNVRLAPHRLASIVALPVSEEIFQMLAGGPSDPHTPVTSEALYELDSAANRPCYRFLRSVAPLGTQSQH